jgi:hypothetical protein
MPNIIERAKHLSRHHLILRSVFARLRYIGLQVVPYYITREYLDPGLEPILGPGLGPVEVSLLSASEFNDLRGRGFEIGRIKLDAQHLLCFGLKIGGEIGACVCCNLRECHSYLDFPLKEDEAYLFNAATLGSHRGKNLAPFLRYEVYRRLNRLGRSKFYSITEFFNAPAVTFKQKLGARHQKLNLYLLFFNRWQRNITLKTYRI